MFLKLIGLVYELIQETEVAFSTGHPVLSDFGFLNPYNLPDTIADLPEYEEVCSQSGNNGQLFKYMQYSCLTIYQ